MPGRSVVFAMDLFMTGKYTVVTMTKAAISARGASRAGFLTSPAEADSASGIYKSP